MKDIIELNPFIRSAKIYQKTGNKGYAVPRDYRAIFILGGALNLTAGEQKYGIPAGGLCIIPPYTRYRLRSDFIKMAVVNFDLTPYRSDVTVLSSIPFDESADYDVPFETLPPFDRVIVRSELSEAKDSFLKLSELFVSCSGLYRSEASAIFKLLLLRVAELEDESALPSTMADRLDKYIGEHITEDITNTEIGSLFGYHPYYVSKLIKERRGITLKQYVINYRINWAKSYLELTDKSIADIAEECGFTDASYMTKIFSKNVGMTPKEYRNTFKDVLI